MDGQINPGGETIATAGAVLASSEEEPDSDDDGGDESDEHLIPEQPGETHDPMETSPPVPGTQDGCEFKIEWWDIDPPIGKRT